MKQTGDLNLVKKLNKSIVLEMIRTQSPISRAKVSENTGLNKSTVSSLVNELIEEHLVHELGPGESSGGRKPLMLLFNDQAGYAVGVDVRVDAIYALLTDLKGTVLDRCSHKLNDTSPDYVLDVMLHTIRELLNRTPDSPYGIVGVGIGVPGIVDEQGTVLFAPNLHWSNVPLRDVLAEELGLPIVIDNEANTGAVGEQQFGAGQTVHNLLYVSVSHGIGAGIIMGGELYRGSSGIAGEAGHFSIKLDGARCSCGNQGCWELYASENALLRDAVSLQPVQQLLLTQGIHSEDISLEHLLELANHGEKEVEYSFHSLGEHLGIGIANLINLFNPERVIIGNRIALAESNIAAALYEAVEQRSLSFHHAKVSIEFSRLGLDSNALGAAFCALHPFLIKDRISL